MREIKFRGKALSGKWVHGDLVHFTNTEGVDASVIITGHQATAESDDFDYALCYAMNEFKIVIPDTVGQFTGLHDKNGKEIYEGDVVKWILTMPGVGVNGGYEEYETEEIEEIKWDAGALYLGDYCAAGFAYESEDYAEIIGNIHDNPELLKSL